MFNVSPFLNSGKLDLNGDGKDDTLLDALNYAGGPGKLGGARNLLRQTVAALLNAASSEVNYLLSVADVTSQVNFALSRDRDAMLVLAERLDRLNNAGCRLK